MKISVQFGDQLNCIAQEMSRSKLVETRLDAMWVGLVGL